MVEGEKGEPNAIERLTTAVIRADRPGDVRTSRPSHQRASAYLRDTGERVVRFIASPEAVEAVARLIDPSSWRVFDGYLAEMLRKYKGEDCGYDPAAFKDKASMAVAQAVLQLLALKGMGDG